MAVQTMCSQFPFPELRLTTDAERPFLHERINVDPSCRALDYFTIQVSPSSSGSIVLTDPFPNLGEEAVNVHCPT